MSHFLQTIVIVPTYNEAENIPPLIEQILNLEETVDVLIVDDHSPDGTGEVADAIAKTHPRVHVIHREAKLGLGTAYTAGFMRALQQGYERIMTMDTFMVVENVKCIQCLAIDNTLRVI